MQNSLLSVPHHPQQRPADCLAACAAMILKYLGVHIAYDRLLGLLKIEPFGASAYNLFYLSTLGLSVAIDARDMVWLRETLQSNSPVIVLVDTGELPYWPQKNEPCCRSSWV